MALKKLILAGILCFTINNVCAQQNILVDADAPVYHYIKQLQHRGYLLDLNPTSLPYTQKEITESLSVINRGSLNATERQWVDALDAHFKPVESNDAQTLRGGFNIQAGSYLGNSRRQNMLRALGNDVFTYPAVDFGGYIEADPFIAKLGLQHNLYFIRDPDGLDAANRLYIRSEDVYLGYNGDWLQVYIGRFNNQWGPFGETSTILSTNSYSFDQINIRFGSDTFSFRSVIGELDNIGADSTFTGRDFREGSKRRFFVGHRFDWRPTRHFGIALFESVIYSGGNSGFSLKYLNPLHAYTFVTDNNPKNDENNLLLGLMLWGQWQGFTVNTQLMIDDLQVESVNEKNNFAFTSSLYKAELFGNMDLGIEFEAVSHQAYVSEQPEGRYVYLKKGLATQFNDYILSSVYANIYGGSGLTFTPRVQWLLQGEQTINQPQVKTRPDGSAIDLILTGNEEQTIRPSVSVRFQSSTSFWIEGNAGANFVSDVDHQAGVNRTRFAGFLRFGIDFSIF